jgi:hypothetical protein
MDRATSEPAIKIILIQIHAKLDEAARIAKAANACAMTGAIARRRRGGLDGCRAIDLWSRPAAGRRFAAKPSVWRIA